jgi:hypothetical protein
MINNINPNQVISISEGKEFFVVWLDNGSENIKGNFLIDKGTKKKYA